MVADTTEAGSQAITTTAKRVVETARANSGEITATTKGVAATTKAKSEDKTEKGLPTPQIPKLGENLLQINVYLDNLSEQIIATTATYAPVTCWLKYFNLTKF